MAYFRTRTPKKLLLFKNKLTRCMTGQNATGRATEYTLARRLLAGPTLANFNHATNTHGNESLDNYIRCIQAVTLRVFPQKPLKIRKDG